MKSTKKDPVLGTVLSEKEISVSVPGQPAPASNIALDKANEAFFANGFQDAAAIILRDGRIIQANTVFCERFSLQGTSASWNLFDCLSAGDRRLLERKFLLALHNGSACTASLRVSQTNRQPIDLEIYAAHGMLYLKERVSKAEVQREVPIQLTHSPAVSPSFLDIIPLPALLYNQNHELLSVNQKFSTLTRGSNNSQNQDIRNEGFLEEHISMLESARKALKNGSQTEIKCRLQIDIKEGQSRWVEYTESLVSPGSIPSFSGAWSIAILYDIEALKQQEERFDERQEEVNLFMDRASHDLKGPLKSMMSLFPIMEYEFGRDTSIMEYVRHYHNGISRLYRILQDMLQLSRINKAELSYSRVNLQQMVEECLQSFRNLPRFFDIAVTKKIEVPSEVLLEESLLQTIVQNLLENAIKYGSEEKPTVSIIITEERNGVVIEVADNGIGIPAELHPRIFERYFRATSKASGSGLGLYLLKQAVDKLQGEVSLQSSEGVGTTFTVYLPYANFRPVSSC